MSPVALREASWIPRAGRGLAAAIGAASAAPVVTSIVGIGGTGKSVLLSHLRASLEESGMRVHRSVESALSAVDASAAWVIDDGHLLSDDAVDRIIALAARGAGAVIVAYRPWPTSDPVARLMRELPPHAKTNLGPYDHDEVFELARHSDDVGEIIGITGGMPWLVHPLLSRRAHRDDSMPAAEILDLVAANRSRTSADLDDLLLALAAGFDLGSTVPASIPADRLDALLEQARASGLLRPDGALIPLVHGAILETAAPHRLRAMQRDLLDGVVEHGHSITDIALALARTGMRDPRVSRALEVAADEILATEPDRARELYAAAIGAGGNPRTTAARRAQAEVAGGDLDSAGRILDDLLATPDAPDAGLAIDTLGAIWAQRGMLSRSAAAYRALGPARMADSASLAAIALIGTGDLAGADAALRLQSRQESSSMFAVAVDQLAQGIRDSVDGTGERALATLVRSSDAMTSSRAARMLPDSPAALAAIVALHSGQLDVATSVITHALSGGQCGPAARRRLLLLSGWTAMLADRPDEVTAVIDEVTVGPPLAARDEFLLGGLRVGLARRLDDAPALARAWHFAREALLRVPVDLYSLLPLGELVVAAARARESALVESQLADAWALLARLDDPPLWSVMLHWSCVQAAILGNRPQDLQPHADALLRASTGSRLAVLISNAGRAWLAVLAGGVDVPQVETAARGLASAGLRWDGARLAGHAAGRAAQRTDMVRLLSFARDLRANPDAPAPDGRTAPGQRGTAHEGGDEQRLSAREIEVARLVLDGKTYREIGAAIFLSPRTAEHHIARIRRRLGATTRSELHSRLREALERPARDEPDDAEGDTP